MSDEAWTWDDQAFPRVTRVFEASSAGLEWCHHLESAPADATVGKVLCVCAAAAIAREVVDAESEPSGGVPEASGPLDLVARWIDGPTDERFESICALIFDEAHAPLDPDPHGVVWWALRTATSSVGNHEAGWALEAVCSGAMSAGFGGEALRAIARRELLSRQSRLR